MPAKSNKYLNKRFVPVKSLLNAANPPSLFYIENSHYTDKLIGHLKLFPSFFKNTTNKLVSSNNI